MFNKETVIEVVRSLPDDVSLEEILVEIETLAAIQRGVDAAEQGRLVPHEEVKRKFESWFTKSNGPDQPSPTSKQSSTT